jgi:hypothetical protein
MEGDDRLRLFLWMVGGGGLLGVVGLLFGALTGLLTHWDGRYAGGFLGRKVLQAIVRVSEQPPSPSVRAAIVGAAEGACFLGLVGLVLGAVVGHYAALDVAAVAWLALAAVLLPVTAALFGILAYGLSRAGTRILGLFCCGGLIGAFVGSRLGATDGILIGSIVGALTGFALGLVARRRERKDPARPSEARVE